MRKHFPSRIVQGRAHVEYRQLRLPVGPLATHFPTEPAAKHQVFQQFAFANKAPNNYHVNAGPWPVQPAQAAFASGSGSP